MILGIVIATYQRPDGKTPFYITRMLTSVMAQTFQEYQVYLIGDAYNNETELMGIAVNFPKVKCFNLKKSPERERYGFGNIKMWCAGGVTAANKGIDNALEDGCEYICHLSHDDLWERNHLEIVNKIIQEKSPMFICTLSTYGTSILPKFSVTNEILSYYPIDGGMVASSACVKYSDTKLRPIDRFAKEGIVSPLDAYLWEQLREEMKITGKRGYVATTLTCHHDEEGYAMNRQQIK